MEIIDIQKARKKRTSRGKLNIKRLLIFAVLFIAFIVLVVNMVRYISFCRLDMTQAVETEIYSSVPCEVAVIRNETLIPANVAGEFVPVVTEGAKVHNGTLIGNLNSEDGTACVYADRSGLVFYETDGWENVLTPDTMYSTDWAGVFARMRQQASGDIADTAAVEQDVAGRNVARLMENLTAPYVCVYVSGNVEDYIQDENKLYLRFAELGDDITIKLKFDKNEDGEYDIRPEDHYYVLRMITDNRLFNTYRFGEAELMGEQHSGIAVPATAITESEDGDTGVYVSNKKRLSFRKVEVLFENEELAIVDGVKVTDDVAAEPGHARVGQKIY